MDAIILKNTRVDLAAVKPIAQKVLLSQKRLLETLQKYKDLTSKQDYDPNDARKLQWKLWRLHLQQQDELERLREVETKTPGHPSNDLLCTEDLESLEESTPVKKEPTEKIRSKTDANSDQAEPLTFRITGSAIVPRTGSFSNENSMEFIIEECDSSSESAKSLQIAEDVMSPERREENEKTNPSKAEDLTEADLLLQKIERSGQRATQGDFMSAIGLVHKSNYSLAEQKLAEQKLLLSNGKKITTGPWQIMDVPTKVTSRRSNYLSSNGLVTVRQRDPYLHVPPPLTCTEFGVKTRNKESSRGSSRTSSRASSPVSGTRADPRDLVGLISNPRAHNLMKARAARAMRRKGKARLGTQVAKPLLQVKTTLAPSTPKPILAPSARPAVPAKLIRLAPKSLGSAAIAAAASRPLKSLPTPLMINNSVSITPVVPQSQATRPSPKRKRSESDSGIVFLPLNKAKPATPSSGTATSSSSAAPASVNVSKKPTWTIAVSSDGTPVYNLHYEEATPAKPLLKQPPRLAQAPLNAANKSVKEPEKTLKPKISNADSSSATMKDQQPSEASKAAASSSLNSGKVFYFPFKDRMKSFSFSSNGASASASGSKSPAPSPQSAAAPPQTTAITTAATPALVKKPGPATPISLLKPIVIMSGNKNPGATFIPLQNIAKSRPALVQLSSIMKNNTIRPGKIMTSTTKVATQTVRLTAPVPVAPSPPAQVQTPSPPTPQLKAQPNKEGPDHVPTIIVADMSN